MFRFLGGLFLIIGAIIGGGILAIPIVSAKLGFTLTLLLIILAWATMMKTGLYVLALSVSCPGKYNTYYSFVGAFLGKNAQAVTVLLYLWLLYFCLSSYISGCAALVMMHLPPAVFLSHFNISLLFVLLLGTVVVISAKLIVRMNAALVVAKLLLLILVLGAILPQGTAPAVESWSLVGKGEWPVLLVIINAFGFQFIIPSLVSYYGQEKALFFKWMIIVSTTVVLAVYVAWLYAIDTLIPMQGDNGLLAIAQSANQLVAFNQSLVFHLQSNTVITLLSMFETVALFGSFFCVSLGIYDFLRDVCKTDHRLVVGLLTFVPPLSLSFISENMYIHAMSLAGYIAIILEIIIPVAAVFYSARRASV